MARALPQPDSPAARPPRLMHGRDWSGEDVTGWLMSEKLDGVRALWDPASGQLLSRSGRPFAAPAWWLAGLPDVPLDGELYLGRGRFEEVRAIAQSSRDPERWRGVELHAFDLPGDRLPAADRVHALAELEGGPMRPVHHAVCFGVRHMLKRLSSITAGGGEGLMLLRPEARYEPGRTWSLLKVKPGAAGGRADAGPTRMNRPPGRITGSN